MLDPTASGVGGGIFGIEFDGTVEVGDGSIEVPFVPLDLRAAGIGVGGFRVELDDPAEVRQGPVEIAFVLLGIAPVAEGANKIGIEFQGLVEIGDGPIEVPLVALGQALLHEIVGGGLRVQTGQATPTEEQSGEECEVKDRFYGGGHDGGAVTGIGLQNA